MAPGSDPTSAFTVGMRASSRKPVSQNSVATFADVVGDHNPVHVDESYAASTRFQKPIAHGPLVTAFIGALVSEKLPGPGTLYIREEMTFLAPVFVGDEVELSVEIVEILDRHRMRMAARCTTRGKLAIQGELVVYI